MEFQLLTAGSFRLVHLPSLRQNGSRHLNLSPIPHAKHYSSYHKTSGDCLMVQYGSSAKHAAAQLCGELRLVTSNMWICKARTTFLQSIICPIFNWSCPRSGLHIYQNPGMSQHSMTLFRTPNTHVHEMKSSEKGKFSHRHFRKRD